MNGFIDDWIADCQSVLSIYLKTLAAYNASCNLGTRCSQMFKDWDELRKCLGFLTQCPFILSSNTEGYWSKHSQFSKTVPFLLLLSITFQHHCIKHITSGLNLLCNHFCSTNSQWDKQFSIILRVSPLCHITPALGSHYQYPPVRPHHPPAMGGPAVFRRARPSSWWEHHRWSGWIGSVLPGSYRHPKEAAVSFWKWAVRELAWPAARRAAVGEPSRSGSRPLRAHTAAFWRAHGGSSDSQGHARTEYAAFSSLCQGSEFHRKSGWYSTKTMPKSLYLIKQIYPQSSSLDESL